MIDKEWIEISKDDVIYLINQEINEATGKFINKAKGEHKFSFMEKVKGAKIGHSIIKTVFNVAGTDFVEARILTEGFKKCEKELKKGKVIEFDNCRLKMEETKYFKQKS